MRVRTLPHKAGDPFTTYVSEDTGRAVTLGPSRVMEGTWVVMDHWEPGSLEFRGSRRQAVELAEVILA